MILEKSALLLFTSRLKKMSEFEKIPDILQSKQLRKLIKIASNTTWGKKYDYSSIKSYSDFATRVPIQNYEDAKPYIQKMMDGEKNILWPENIKWFAQSSGTTNDKSKFIPVSQASLKECHYRGSMDTVASYLNNIPNSKLFSGKGLILGGSHRAIQNNKVRIGDLSAILIENINPLANLFRTPSKKIMLMNEWEAKLSAICQSVKNQDITNISGVPSWILVLIKKILQESEKKTLTELWPNLEVFFHGGISFSPYLEQYQELIPSKKMHYMETYNASEGFFAIQNDLEDPSMLLLLDNGIFYEFIPIEDIKIENPRIFCLEEIELNKNYAIVMSSNNGLWRYKIGDTVKFTSKYPYKIIITGRTQYFINAFGEELMADNAEKALLIACKRVGGKIKEYTVAPIYISTHTKGKHQWLIEFEEFPTSIDFFANELDIALQEQNSDYEAKRYKNITLDPPEIRIARQGLFYDWLKMKGKLGGQFKVPRLCNTREHIEELLAINK